MTAFKCKMCGGSLTVTNETAVCECAYCGTCQTVTKSRDENIINMFNRATNLRLKAEFDKAYDQYEKIVLICPDDSESYWGLILCKYGVEYVKDPVTGCMIPTLHRTQVEPVTTDPDYLNVLEYADKGQRIVYEREAAQINSVQKDVLAVARIESPYDVFICYKERDENGSRTQDSVIANDIYHQLTQVGLKVFYAAITLEDKLGQEYEPYIYAALHSAKVMLVIGTRPEYFEAPWVRNEWSRYLKIVDKDRSKLLIPCYRDMDSADVPPELSNLPSQDMGRIGFITETVRGIKKVLNIQVDSFLEPDVPGQVNVSDISQLLKQGNHALVDDKWDEAMQLFDQVLDENPEEYRAYIGQLCAEMEISSEEELVNIGKPIISSNSYKRACLFGGEEVEARLYGYVTQHEYNLNQEQYNAAVKEMNHAESSQEFEELVFVFGRLGEFKDSLKMAKECRKKAKEYRQNETITKYSNSVTGMRTATTAQDFEMLKHEFLDLRDYKDSRQKAKECEYNGLISRYNAAIKQELKPNDYIALMHSFRSLDGFMDSRQKVEECIPYLEAAQKREHWDRIRNCKQGDVVTFGPYDWNVVAQYNNLKLLLCTDIVEKKDTNYKSSIFSRREITGWERCDLRKWLNEDFISCFSDEERRMICKIRLANPDNHYRSSGKWEGRETEDCIFLLSIDEVEKIDQEILKAKMDWWLRTNGVDGNFGALVSKNGVLDNYGVWRHYLLGVRPAMYIKTD